MPSHPTKNRSEHTNALRGRLARVALGDLLSRAGRRFGGRTALIEGDHRIVYRELDDASNRYANALLAQGLAPGDRVAMLCENSAEMVVAMFGIYKAGMVWVPINTALAAPAVSFILEHSQARHLVADAGFLASQPLREIIGQLHLSGTVCRDAHAAVPEGWLSIAASMAGQSATLPEVAIDGGDLVQIMYTSGTTGRQKGVMHSHASIQSVLMSNLLELGMGVDGEVFSCHLPVFHVGQHSLLLSALLCGASSTVMRGFDPGALMAAVAQHRITLLFGLPMMFRAMLNHPVYGQTDLSSLKLCLYAMAPMPRTLLAELLENFCPRFALCSGQTEIYTAATVFRPEQQTRRFGAYWGEASLANEVAVMSDDGQLLGAGQVGEIVYRGPNLMLGYYQDPQATEEVWRHGWHHSGDLGCWDADGQLLFMDRIKDMIKTGGENVPSIKVEEVLLRHPAVHAAAVVGVPHARWGEAIVAFVVLDDNRAVNDHDLMAHCQVQLGTFERPKAFVRLHQMPMTTTGKIRKFELRRAHQDYFEGAAP